MSRAAILRPGRNCWRIERAERFAFLVDAAPYFRALRAGLLTARHQVLVLAWDVHSELRLVRDGGGDGAPESLRDLFDALAAGHEELAIHVLDWDYTMLYAGDREWLPALKLGWKTHPRVRFRLDAQHPIGGCHHQKVVVVDDALAFAGGIDLTHSRWDTPEHRPDDPRRVTAEGDAYAPHHDVQAAVSGDAARALGELARARWFDACGERLDAPPPRDPREPWPAELEPDLTGVDVAIARTQPACPERGEVREVEQLFLDSIAAARRFLYVENQYLTSRRIGDALAARLAEPDGPELVIVLPQRTTAWLEQYTMDVLRVRLLERLRAADRHGRLRVVRPRVPGLEPQCVNVHAKVMVVDDRLARVGSANLNNRSMGLDTECDLALESRGDPRVESAIAGFRARLLAEHLGSDAGEIARATAESGSLVATIERFAGGGRTLEAIELALDPEIARQVPDEALVDPERPIDAEELARALVREEERGPAGRRVLTASAFVLGALALTLAWRFTPLAHWVDPRELVDSTARFRELPAAPLLALAAFVVGGLVAFPVTALILAAVLALGPFVGFACALAGSLASAAITYWLGGALGGKTVQRLGGKRLQAVRRRLVDRGLFAVVVVRVIPIAPFTLVNLVAGASRLSWRDYALGTFLGMTPGIVAVTLFADRARAALAEPSWTNAVLLAATGAAVALGGWLFARWLIGRSRRRRELAGS